MSGESYRNRLETYAGTIGTSTLCRRCHAWQGELGQEPLPDCLGWARGEPPEACQVGCFLCHLRLVMAGLKRVLRDDGLCFVELADSYATGGSGQTVGSHSGDIRNRSQAEQSAAVGQRKRAPVAGIPAKSLLLVPERFRLACLQDGWVVRSVIRWAKKAPMPESCRDRFTSAVSEVVMLSKGSRYYSDMQAVKEPTLHPELIGKSNGHRSSKGDGSPRPDGWVQQSGEHRLGASSRNPRNYAFLDPDEWMPISNAVHLSPEPQRRAHYASFGPKAIAPFLKLATSERGACAECGSAWERVTEKTGDATYLDRWGRPVQRVTQDAYKKDGRDNRDRQHIEAGVPTALGSSVYATTGWRPRCQCQAETVPCRVLDPFCGSGTVLVVSENLGMDATGIDLSPSYAEMSALRLQLEGMPLFANGHATGVEPELPSQVSMFGDGR